MHNPRIRKAPSTTVPARERYGATGLLVSGASVDIYNLISKLCQSMIPASVSSALTSLLAGVNAAYPLASASIFTLSSLQQQANSVIVAVDTALLADDTNIVAPVLMTSGALTYAAAINALVGIAQEEIALAELSALAGRAAINIANAGV